MQGLMASDGRPASGVRRNRGTRLFHAGVRKKRLSLLLEYGGAFFVGDDRAFKTAK